MERYTGDATRALNVALPAIIALALAMTGVSVEILSYFKFIRSKFYFSFFIYSINTYKGIVLVACNTTRKKKTDKNPCSNGACVLKERQQT